MRRHGDRAVLASILVTLLAMIGAPSAHSQASDAMPTMRAIVQRERGGPDVLMLTRQPIPVPGVGQVRIRVVAAGVNPIDWKARQPNYVSPTSGAMPPLQMIPGNDVAGVIDAVGEGVTQWRVGDAVYAALHRSRSGGYAEYTVTYADDVARKPVRLGFEEAAALPTAVMTAWRYLVDTNYLAPGKRVLIHAGAGSVGSAAIQIAKARGAWVATTASARHHEWLRALGADQVIDYQTSRFEEVVRDIDVVFDTVGGDNPARSAQVLRRGGTLVAFSQLPAEVCVPLEIACPKPLPPPNNFTRFLEQAAALVDAGQLSVRIDRALPLEQAAAAQEASQRGGASGKLILRIGAAPVAGRPNILLIVADDLGMADLGAWGGEIDTPNLDRLTARAVRFTNFHTAPTCSPTRAMLLTGVDHHRAGLGAMAESLQFNPQLKGRPGYEGHLNARVVTIASRFREAGYTTMVSGKWHVGYEAPDLPPARGFDRSFVLLQGGAGHFDGGPLMPFDPVSSFREDGRAVEWPRGQFSTNYFTERALGYLRERPRDRPFFAYVAYTAPHWPLQAPAATLRKYRGRYDAGWDAIRAQRLEKMRALGLLGNETRAAPRPANVPAWSSLTPEQQRREARLMETYAAMVDNLDSNIGRLLRALERDGALRNTVIVFMSDNGAEAMVPDTAPLPGLKEWVARTFDNRFENIGKVGSYVGYGPQWAHVSAAPLRAFKGTTFEGGIRAPAFIALPGGEGKVFNEYAHARDLSVTLLRVAGLAPTQSLAAESSGVWPMEGRALLDDSGAPIVAKATPTAHFELFGHRAARRGDWKAVSLWRGAEGPGPWSLFDLRSDPSESQDLANARPDELAALIALHDSWTREYGVLEPARNAPSYDVEKKPASP
jgi:arylsulfatase